MSIRSVLGRSIKVNPRHNQSSKGSTGLSHKGALECRECHHVLFKKSWQPRERTQLPRDVEKSMGLCPACEMSRNGLYEGEVTISSVPTSFAADLLNLIRKSGKQAEERNCQHRVLALEEKGTEVRVTTSENQLAVRLGKKIAEAFRGRVAMASPHYSREPYKVDRVQLTFS